MKQFPVFRHQTVVSFALLIHLNDHVSSDKTTNAAASTAVTWLTETKYERGMFRVGSELEVTVRDGDTLVTKVKHPGLCSATNDDQDSASTTFNVSCYQREFLYQRRCISAIDSDKYIVEHNDGLNAHYVCMKFVARNRNVVEVWLGPRLHNVNDDDVCSDQLLQREPWPWIASSRVEWHFCPLVGGYDVVLNTSVPSRQCTGELRSNRLESECINGEGLHLTLSSQRECSPLPERVSELRLECWASWSEDSSLFMVLSQHHKQPQFVLRVPHVTETISPLPVRLFLSPVCPSVDIKYTDLADIGYIDMVLTSSESGICYDESHQCRQLTQNERCTKNAMYQYANVCKKSCGLCNLLPSTRPECRFSNDVLGEWLLAEVDGLRKVTITTGYLTVAGLGEFVCKGKHWNAHDYKLLSHYSNGCRPRYSCVRLERHSDDSLLIQLSHSSLTDTSFEVCRFEDDLPPLGNRIHSSEPKILIPWMKVQLGSCGLRGSVDVSMSSTGNSPADDTTTTTCRGRLSDWNSAMCQSRGNMQLIVGSGQRCPSNGSGSSESAHRRDFKCLAYATLTEEVALLWTQPKDGSNTSVTCWVIGRRSTGTSLAVDVWTELHQLDRAQCGFELDSDVRTARSESIQSMNVIGTVVSSSSSDRRRCNLASVTESFAGLPTTLSISSPSNIHRHFHAMTTHRPAVGDPYRQRDKSGRPSSVESISRLQLSSRASSSSIMTSSTIALWTALVASTDTVMTLFH